MAVVEFVNDGQAGAARAALQGVRIMLSHTMKITYVKKQHLGSGLYRTWCYLQCFCFALFYNI